MNCEYIGSCGSCTLGQMDYEEQLNFKLDREIKRFKDIYNSKFDLIQSTKSHFRNRAEFRIFHKLGNITYAMSSIDKKLLPIKSCTIVSKSIAFVMEQFLDEVKKEDILTQKFFSVEFLTSTTKDILITMIYHKKLDDVWIEKAKQLAKTLNVKIIGRSRKQKVVLSVDYIEEELLIENIKYKIKYKEGGFTQPNAKVNIKMIEWVLKNIEASDDLCELYCGGGNFTIPLSQKFNKVLATEISKTSIKSAKENCLLNDITNIKFIRMSSQEFVEAKNQIREFRRLKQEDVNLQDYNFSTIFVDPPRAGLDNTTLKLSKEFDQIIYISCNPETLYRDLISLKETHTIKTFALFDQFAYSLHCECGVILNKNKI